MEPEAARRLTAASRTRLTIRLIREGCAQERMSVKDQQIVSISETQSLFKERQGGSPEEVCWLGQIGRWINGAGRVAAAWVFHGTGGVVLTTPFPSRTEWG